MKVKVIVDYNDTQLKRLVKAGEEFEVTEARGQRLIEAMVAKAITPTAEKATKGRKKKVEE